MTLATQLGEFLDSRTSLAAARTRERAARDAFIQAQFPLLNAVLVERITAAVGLHSRLALSTTVQTLAVTGRSFATLPQRVVTVAATVDVTPLRVTFTPTLDFRYPDQFGRVECVADFDATLRRSRAAAVAQSLLSEGIQMRGAFTAHLLVLIEGNWIELSPSHLVDACAALMLR